MKKKYVLAALIICACLFAQHVTAEVSSFVFVTDPQSVGPGEVSGAITVQSQNSSGTSEAIAETYDLNFTSSSATGQFLNGSGNAVSTTMSKNTANRTFYYKDSTAGDFVLTVVATGRDSKKSFTATQHIGIGQTTQTPASSTEAENDTTDSGNDTDSDSSGTSAHSSPVQMSTKGGKIDFEISAGRSRLTAVGNKVPFKAIVTKSQDVSEQCISYNWSFGDGSTGQGKEVIHTYYFGGDYAVVVNAVCSDKEAVSRTAVKVIVPELVLSHTAGGIEIYNKSSQEINLDGWKLVGPTRSFTFPQDTLIGTNKKVIFPDKITNVTGEEVKLQNPLGEVFGSAQGVGSISVSDNASTSKQEVIDISGVQLKVNELREKIDELASSQISFESETEVASAVPPVSENGVEVSDVSSLSNMAVSPYVVATANVTNATSAIQIFEAPKQEGFISTVFSLPIKSFNFIKHLFIEE